MKTKQKHWSGNQHVANWTWIAITAHRKYISWTKAVASSWVKLATPVLLSSFYFLRCSHGCPTCCHELNGKKCEFGSGPTAKFETVSVSRWFNEYAIAKNVFSIWTVSIKKSELLCRHCLKGCIMEKVWNLIVRSSRKIHGPSKRIILVLNDSRATCINFLTLKLKLVLSVMFRAMDGTGNSGSLSLMSKTVTSISTGGLPGVLDTADNVITSFPKLSRSILIFVWICPPDREK